jgi:glycine/D-amino acid oxidase-like deaminating enzyme
MRADVLILGQGLAGTLLAWDFERAGIAFAIIDQGHATAATSVAAAMINPLTGRRLVKSWRVESLLPAARAVYQELEVALGVPLWREMTVRRYFADDRERETAHRKANRGDLAPFAAAADEDGIRIRGAAWVNVGALLAAARERWRAAGRLRAATTDLAGEAGRHGLVIDCTGQRAADGGHFGFVPWQFSKGEVLQLRIDGLASDVALNRRQWIVPVGPGQAWVGATHEPAVRNSAPTPAARALLQQSAREILGAGRTFNVIGHRAGVRVTLPDKRPVAGRHPVHQQLGLINGLGSKGALWAPMLARQWTNHLTAGAAFDPEIESGRFPPEQKI